VNDWFSAKENIFCKRGLNMSSKPKVICPSGSHIARLTPSAGCLCDRAASRSKRSVPGTISHHGSSESESKFGMLKRALINSTQSSQP